tara:strand:+ start:379 stop:591 length:213 start_codon:yes stop_codon:yes gene_type:complete
MVGYSKSQITMVLAMAFQAFLMRITRVITLRTTTLSKNMATGTMNTEANELIMGAVFGRRVRQTVMGTVS